MWQRGAPSWVSVHSPLAHRLTNPNQIVRLSRDFYTWAERESATDHCSYRRAGLIQNVPSNALECPLLPTCKQAVHEEDDDCANYGTDQSCALARPVPS